MQAKAELERIATALVDAVFQVHVALGPGLMESAYEACLVHELRKRRLAVRRGVTLPVRYDDLEIDVGYRVDLLLEDAVIVENKAVQVIAPIHEAQLLTYLKLSGLKLGFLVNWNVPLIKDGIRRMVNRL